MEKIWGKGRRGISAKGQSDSAPTGASTRRVWGWTTIGRPASKVARTRGAPAGSCTGTTAVLAWLTEPR